MSGYPSDNDRFREQSWHPSYDPRYDPTSPQYVPQTSQAVNQQDGTTGALPAGTEITGRITNITRNTTPDDPRPFVATIHTGTQQHAIPFYASDSSEKTYMYAYRTQQNIKATSLGNDAWSSEVLDPRLTFRFQSSPADQEQLYFATHDFKSNGILTELPQKYSYGNQSKPLVLQNSLGTKLQIDPLDLRDEDFEIFNQVSQERNPNKKFISVSLDRQGKFQCDRSFQKEIDKTQQSQNVIPSQQCPKLYENPRIRCADSKYYGGAWRDVAPSFTFTGIPSMRGDLLTLATPDKDSYGQQRKISLHQNQYYHNANQVAVHMGLLDQAIQSQTPVTASIDPSSGELVLQPAPPRQVVSVAQSVPAGVDPSTNSPILSIQWVPTTQPYNTHPANPNIPQYELPRKGAQRLGAINEAVTLDNETNEHLVRPLTQTEAQHAMRGFNGYFQRH